MPLSSVLGAQSLVKPGVCTSTTRPASPFEGQTIYETDTDLVKSYNGTSWVTIGPATIPTAAVTAVGGAFVDTGQSTTSTTYTDLATTGPTVTLTTGTKAIITISCIAINNVANANAESGVTAMSFAVSGASTISASDTRSAQGPQIHTSHYNTRSATIYLDTLTAGSNTFTAKYRVAGSLATGTGTFYYRHMTVTAI